MGSYSIKVVRSKTAIVPVNASLLPRTEEESERCKRTVYVTNIDLDVEVRLSGPDARQRPQCSQCANFATQPAEVSGFFETLCGPVAQLHLTKLDSQGTQVAFVEFSTAHAADRALSCGGARLKVRARAHSWAASAPAALFLGVCSRPPPATARFSSWAQHLTWSSLCRRCLFESARPKPHFSLHAQHLLRAALVCVEDGVARACSRAALATAMATHLLLHRCNVKCTPR